MTWMGIEIAAKYDYNDYNDYNDYQDYLEENFHGHTELDGRRGQSQIQ